MRIRNFSTRRLDVKNSPGNELIRNSLLTKQNDKYNLRWFPPSLGVLLCGHATLSSAHVLWSEGHLYPDEEAQFATKSGRLIAKHQGDRIELNFPVDHSQAIPTPAELNDI